MYCPNCGSYAEMNFCAYCGTDLRNIVISGSVPRTDGDRYARYRRYYPDKIQAIQALRIDTGMNAVEAKRIVDRLFGADVMSAKPEFSGSGERRGAYPTYGSTDTVEVDVRQLAQKHYPNRGNAIRALCQEGVREADARYAIEEAFREIGEERRRKEAERQKKVRKALGTAGKGVGLAALTAGYIGLRTIAGLTKPYMKKRR